MKIKEITDINELIDAMDMANEEDKTMSSDRTTRVVSRWGKKPTKDRCITMVKTCDGDLHVSIDQGFDGGTSTEILLNPSSARSLADFIDEEYPPSKVESMVLDRKTLEIVKGFAISEQTWKSSDESEFGAGYICAMTKLISFVDKELKHLEESK